eukprot:2376653-Pyramimonas_sp.AAC.1
MFTGYHANRGLVQVNTKKTCFTGTNWKIVLCLPMSLNSAQSFTCDETCDCGADDVADADVAQSALARARLDPLDPAGWG